MECLTSKYAAMKLLSFYIHIKNIASMILRNGSAFLAAQSIMILFTLFLTRKPLDGNIDRLLKNTRQLKRLLGTCQPLMYFDKRVFTSLVSKVTISDTSFEFELINGMRVSERRTSK